LSPISAAIPDCVRDTVIVLVENDLVDWSFGNGDAQYLR